MIKQVDTGSSQSVAAQLPRVEKDLGPDIALIGAMKCGTTTLAALLGRHPDLAVSSPKEPGYFSLDAKYEKGPQWYADHFSHAKPGQLHVDASTCYSRSRAFPNAMPRLAESAADAKLVYVLRHPVERVYSHYCHVARVNFQVGKGMLRLRDVIDHNPQCVSASEYARELENIYRFYDPKQVLCLRFEETTSDSRQWADRLTEFLRVPAFSDAMLRSVGPENVKGDAIQTHQASRAADNLRRNPVVQIIKPLIPSGMRSGLSQSAKTLMHRIGIGRSRRKAFEQGLDPFADVVRKELHDRLDPDTVRLGQMLDWDVRPWLDPDKAQ